MFVAVIYGMIKQKCALDFFHSKNKSSLAL